MANLGEQIRLLRFKKNMTQKELADVIGTTKASVSNYEKSQRIPKFDVLCKISKALGVDTGVLLACLAPDEAIAGGSQAGSRRPKRVKKLLAAFDRLTDEGQLKVIEFAEMACQVPMYQKTLQGMLQQYIYDSCGLKYVLLDSPQGEMAHGQGTEGGGCGYSVMLLSYYNKTKKEGLQYWDFFYCTPAQPLDGDAGRGQDADEIIGCVSACFTGGPGHRLAFVTDDESLYGRLFERYVAGRTQVPAVFLLVDRDTWEIRDEQQSGPSGQTG